MTRYSGGERIEPFEEESISGSSVVVPNPAMRLTHLQFRRFAGCPVCNFHLLTMARRKAELDAAGIAEVVVFHSSRAEMIKYQAQLPFNCIADPAKRLYRKFGVETSLLALLNPGVLINGAKWVIGQRRFYRQTENGIFGLPADFLIDASGTFKAVHYGKHADDHWSVDRLLELAGAISA